MNKEQRARLAEILDQLNGALCEIENIKDEEESKYDNLPENFQDSERGEAIQDGIDALDDTLSYLSDAIDSLENIC